MLDQFGATETQQRAFYALLDTLVARARGREQDRPTFAYFEMQLDQILTALRGDRAFTRLLIGTLKLERPSYRELHASQWHTAGRPARNLKNVWSVRLPFAPCVRSYGGQAGGPSRSG